MAYTTETGITVTDAEIQRALTSTRLPRSFADLRLVQIGAAVFDKKYGGDKGAPLLNGTYLPPYEGLALHWGKGAWEEERRRR